MNLAEKMGAGVHADNLMAAAVRWGIVNPEDQARWLAQCSVESGGFKRLREGLNYRPERLLAVFPGRNGMDTLTDARRIVAGGRDAIAEAIYGGAWGAKNLGNTEPGDGAKFLGRGFIQTTGRYNYNAVSWGMFGDDRLLDSPEMLEESEHAAQSAAWYWYNKKLNGITDVRAVTKKINSGLLELDERIALTDEALQFVRNG